LAQAKQETRLDVAGQTDVGCVRKNNEDSFGIDTPTGVFVVCDGMGGHAAGEVASHLAVQSVIEFFGAERDAQSGPDLAELLRDAVAYANRRVFDTAHLSEAHHGMGTTLVALAAEVHGAQIANVGDSRAYVLHANELRQVTNDHSLVMEQVRRGVLTLEEARKSSVQNIILRALGSEPNVEVELHDVPLESGDTVLLTSDGLCRHVPDEKIADILQKSKASDDAVHTLIKTAKDGGGEDNITCVVLRVQ
jgi:protein phosphatase